MDGTLPDCTDNGCLGKALGGVECDHVIRCDNMGTVAVVNSGYSKAAPVMHLLRCLFSFCQGTFSIYAASSAYTGGPEHLGRCSVQK